MWLVTPHFCQCTCTVLLLMNNFYLILFILFWEVLVPSKSLFTIRCCYLCTFFIALFKTCTVSSTLVSHLHLNLYRNWPKLLNSVILVHMIIFLSAVSLIYVAIYHSEFFFPSLCLFTFQQSMCISFISSLHKGNFSFFSFYLLYLSFSSYPIENMLSYFLFQYETIDLWSVIFLFAFCLWIPLHLFFIISHILNLSPRCVTRSIPAQISTVHLL